MDWKKIKHFKQEEFACPHCGECHMDEEFMLMLDSARDDAGVPFKINSGYRCQEHDNKVAGEDAAVDNHVTGKAADVVVDGSRIRYKIVSALIMAGFTRVGLGKNFLHVDYCDADENKPTEVMWLYGY
jgi:uncharacterized protein YcbK (DUF882 family)